jgi:nitrate/nitrite transporter NarK
MNAFQILVVILSITLAVFLVLAIIATTLFIHFMKDMKTVPAQMGEILDNLQEVSGAVRDTASPLIMLADLVKKFFPAKSRKSRR